MSVELINEIMHNTSIPFMERMEIVGKMRRDIEDASNTPPFQALSEEEGCVILESLVETRPPQDFGCVRIHVGTVFGANTLAIAACDGRMVVVG